MTATTPRAPAHTTHHPSGTDWSDRLARFGLVGKGVLHAVIGLLALEVALNGTTSGQASPAGAADWIAGRPLGTVALWVLAASLLSLALWRTQTTLTGDPVEDDDVLHRATSAGKALVYGILAATFAGAARGGGSSGDRAQDTARTVFDWPMGAWIVVAIGLAVAAIGIYMVVAHTVGQEFARRVSCPVGSAVVMLGRVGYGLRSIAYLLVGAFLVSAGLSGEQDRAEGLGGALDRVAGAGYGPALLVAVAVGFLTYGAYCVAEARYRRAT